MREKNNSKIETKSVNEIYTLFPSLIHRGFTPEVLTYLYEKDIIGGHYNDEDKDELLLDVKSVELFIEYHNRYYKLRVENVAINIDMIQLSDKQADKKSDSKE